MTGLAAPPAHEKVPASPPALDLVAAPGPDNRTRIVRRRVAYPWSLGRAFAPSRPGEPLLVLPQEAAAGLLAGDRVEQRLTLERDASVRLAFAGATLVLADAPGRRRPARSLWRHALGPGARLVAAAEPHALLPGAELDLATEIALDPSATYIGFEGICLAEGPGGCAWRSELTVRRPDGPPLLIDRQAARDEDLRRAARLPGAPAAFGTLLALAPPGAAAGWPRPCRPARSTFPAPTPRRRRCAEARASRSGSPRPPAARCATPAARCSTAPRPRLRPRTSDHFLGAQDIPFTPTP